MDPKKLLQKGDPNSMQAIIKDVMPVGYILSLPQVTMLTFLQMISDSEEASQSFKGSSKKDTKLLFASCAEGVLGENSFSVRILSLPMRMNKK